MTTALYGPAMKYAFVLGLLLASLPACLGQEPVREVPQYLAKVPERSDFFGEWLRQDGTYKLTVAKGTDGGVTARYFNPDPIKVESAAFREEDGYIILIVVLRDEGYPGSTYQLTYDSSYRILAGSYAMPQSGQRHQVYFKPVKQP
jgi:hypothetical protein